MKNRFGFTLAEVLITLGIIGIVAAMTIPNLVKNYQKKITVTKIKNILTILNQALKLSEVDNGEYANWQAPDMATYVETYWIPYFKSAKKCTSINDCGYTGIQYWKKLNGNAFPYPIFETNNIPFTLQDGTFIELRSITSCSQMVNVILVDLNGSAKPNTLGKDVFIFQRYKKGYIAPHKICNEDTYTQTYCGKITNDHNDGSTCARKIEKDGWEIKDDYPW